MLFGKEYNAKMIKECGDQALFVEGEEEADTVFAKTVHTLTQKFCLVPQNVKESYLLHVL